MYIYNIMHILNKYTTYLPNQTMPLPFLIGIGTYYILPLPTLLVGLNILIKETEEIVHSRKNALG